MLTRRIIYVVSLGVILLIIVACASPWSNIKVSVTQQDNPDTIIVDQTFYLGRTTICTSVTSAAIILESSCYQTRYSTGSASDPYQGYVRTNYASCSVETKVILSLEILGMLSIFEGVLFHALQRRLYLNSTKTYKWLVGSVFVGFGLCVVADFLWIGGDCYGSFKATQYTGENGEIIKVSRALDLGWFIALLGIIAAAFELFTILRRKNELGYLQFNYESLD
jgi:hypothetical protein